MGRVVHASKSSFLNSDRKWNSKEKTCSIFTIDFARIGEQEAPAGEQSRVEAIPQDYKLTKIYSKVSLSA